MARVKVKGQGSRVEGAAAENGSHLKGGALISQLGTREREQTVEAQQRYRQLVIDVADDVDVDPDYAADVLAAVGMSAGQLCDDVDAAHRRRKLQTEAAKLEPLRDEARRIAQQLEAAEAEFADVMRRHREDAAAVQHQSQDIHRRIAAAERAERLLYENCPDAGLLEELADVRARLSDVVQRYGEAKTWLQRDESLEAKYRGIIRNPDSIDELADAEEKLRDLAMDNRRRAFEKLEAERAAIEDEEKAIRQRMVEA